MRTILLLLIALQCAHLSCITQNLENLAEALKALSSTTTWHCTFYGWKEVEKPHTPGFRSTYDDIRYELSMPLETNSQRGPTVEQYRSRIAFGNRMSMPKKNFEPVEAILKYIQEHPQAHYDDTFVNDIAPGTCVLVK